MYSSIAHLTHDERLARLGLQGLQSRNLYYDLLFLHKLKFNHLHISLTDVSIQTSLLTIVALFFYHLLHAFILIFLLHAAFICGIPLILM